jgi:hypothetical protein
MGEKEGIGYFPAVSHGKAVKQLRVSSCRVIAAGTAWTPGEEGVTVYQRIFNRFAEGDSDSDGE